jgi:hypothetical protein
MSDPTPANSCWELDVQPLLYCHFHPFDVDKAANEVRSFCSSIIDIDKVIKFVIS